MFISKKNILAIIFALLASALYAISIPFSKLLLAEVRPAMLASYLYLGAGVGIGVAYLFSKSKKMKL